MKKYISTPYFQVDKFFQILYCFSLFRLVHSSYYLAIFNILTGQKRDMTELKILWWINMNQQQLQIYFEPWTRERMCHQLYKC